MRAAVFVLMLTACGTGPAVVEDGGPLEDASLDAALTRDAGRDAGGPNDAGVDASTDGGSRPDAPLVPDAGGPDGGCEVTPNGGCPAGEACYFDYVDPPMPGGPYRVRRCMPDGTRAAGEACDLDGIGVNDCVAGFYCGGGGSDSHCFQYCRSATAGLCPTGVCMTSPVFGDGYGTCEVAP